MNFLKKKYVYIPISILAYLILLAYCTKITGVLTIFGAIISLVYLFTKNEKFKNKNKIFKTLSTIGLLFMLLVGLVSVNGNNTPTSKSVATASSINKTKENKKDNLNEESKNKIIDKKLNKKTDIGELKIHYINVGQGDSILIQQGKHNMLIDAGGNNQEKPVSDYLKNQNITKLDYIIGTHPHEDHIGGLDYVINSFKIGKVFMPKKTATTKTFEDVINAIKRKKLKITSPKIGDEFSLGEAKFKILSGEKIYDNTNDCSITIRVEFGENKFLFTGDAEGTSEMDMVKGGQDIKADVLKIGHHGSKTSTVVNFLDKVNPKYAVISCGKDNKYGHPSQSVMDRLKVKNIEVYRTDENGTIILTSDGKDIKFDSSPSSYVGRDGSKDSDNKTTTKTESTNKSSSDTTKSTTVTQSQSQTSSNNVKSTSNSTSTGKSTPTTKAKPKPKNQPSKNNKQNVESGIKVWVSKSGKKYHRIPKCGKMDAENARQMSVEKAKKQGLKKCSKCFN